MNTTGTNSTFAKQGQQISDTVNSTLGKVADSAQSMASQGMNALGSATRQVRDTASDLSDSVVEYTKDNPVKALLWAGLAGAALVTLIKALTPSNE